MTAQELTRLGDAELVGHFVDGSPEWHEQRGMGVGSSDIGVILGLSGWKSALTLHYEKRGLIDPAPVSPEQQELFDYGHFMEPFIGELFARRHPDLVVVDKPGSWRNMERPWQLSNPDALIAAEEPGTGDHGILEKKTAKFKADWDENGVPPLYDAQVRWQMDTFGFRYGWIACWFAVGGYGEYLIEADDFIADVNRDAAMEFNRGVDEGVEPEIDGSVSTYTTLRRLNPSIPDPKAETVIPPEIAEQYLAACQQFKAADSELLKWKGHLLAHMGTAKFAFHNGQKIASRVAVRDGVPYLKEA
jgi:predicted phage-related endonuclease